MQEAHVVPNSLKTQPEEVPVMNFFVTSEHKYAFDLRACIQRY